MRQGWDLLKLAFTSQVPPPGLGGGQTYSLHGCQVVGGGPGASLPSERELGERGSEGVLFLLREDWTPPAPEFPLSAS